MRRSTWPLCSQEVVCCKTEESRPRLHRRNDKVEKGARLRGKIVARWMQRKERKLLIEPIRKNNLQAPILNQRFDSKFQELCNTVTSEADCVKSGNIVQQEPRVRVDLDFLTALSERPLVATSGFRVAKINQAMIAFVELGGMNWAARFLQIRW